MNIFTNSKKQKKFILVLVLLIMCNFFYPKQVKAFDFLGNISSFFFFAERGIIGLLNNIFCDDNNQFVYDVGGEVNGVSTVKVKIRLTPENIIKGRFVLFNANIFEDVTSVESTDPDKYYDDGTGKSVIDGKTTLRNTIAGWYYALRNFAIVALLSVLVYVGIRMITSTISQDKAKYKMMFKDWLVALCLVVVMHYIMVGILNVSGQIVDAIGTSGQAESQTEQIMTIIGGINNGEEGAYEDEGQSEDVRYASTDSDGKKSYYTIGDAFAYELLLLVVLIYTGLFAVKYLKREFTIIFLILLGPISCITYPIDKISDGKAQAFNKWFSEFLYNVIVQPFHLLIYIVLVGSATQLARDNLLYAIICFAVMIPAEKFIKEMFGFRDKLGSPLGAFAGGAVANQMLNKIKGGGGQGGKTGNNGDNTSTPNELPPKTVDKTALTEGEQSGEGNGTGSMAPGSIDKNDDLALESGEEPGGGASAAAAYQNSDDPVGDAERAALEEKIADGEIDEDDLTDEQREMLGKEKDEDENIGSEADSNDTSDTDNELSDNNSEKRTFKDKAKGYAGKAAAIHNQRMAKKWGSASRGKRWVNRGKKLGKGALKFATKTATTGAGALALGTLGFMVGQGSKGAIAGAALGSTLGNKAIKTAGNISDTAKDYYNGMKSDEKREKKALSDFSGDKKQIDNAVLSYRKNHNGEEPSRKELQQELADRFMLSRYGLNDEQINDSLPMYQDKLAELKDKGVDEDRAKEIAASQAKYASNLSKAYSGKDFRDSKTMNNAYEKIKDGLIANTGCTEDIADKYAREYLTEAGKMKSVSEGEIALPPIKEKITIPNNGNMYGRLNFGNDAASQSQQDQVQAIQDVLIEVGFEQEEIKQIMEYSTGNNNDEIIESFATNVKYIISNNVDSNKHIPIGEIQSGRMKSHITKTKENKTVMKENIEKLDLTQKTGIKDEKTLEKMRDLERKNGTTQFREEAGKMIRGEYSKNDKNNLSESALKMAENYRSIAKNTKGNKK